MYQKAAQGISTKHRLEFVKHSMHPSQINQWMNKFEAVPETLNVRSLPFSNSLFFTQIKLNIHFTDDRIRSMRKMMSIHPVNLYTTFTHFNVNPIIGNVMTVNHQFCQKERKKNCENMCRRVHSIGENPMNVFCFKAKQSEMCVDKFYAASKQRPTEKRNSIADFQFSLAHIKLSRITSKRTILNWLEQKKV